MRARQRQHCPCYDSQVEPLELLYHERYKSKINPTPSFRPILSSCISRPPFTSSFLDLTPTTILLVCPMAALGEGPHAQFIR